MNLEMWQQALDAAAIASPDGFTTRDLCAALNRGEAAVRRMIRLLADSGRLKHVGYRSVPMVDGRTTKLPVYQLTK